MGYQQAYQYLLDKMNETGWGRAAFIRNTLDKDRKWGTMSAHHGSVREPVGFIIDVETLGDDRSKVTVYPGSRFYGNMARRWIEQLQASLCAK
jgi:hypothetical protein